MNVKPSTSEIYQARLKCLVNKLGVGEAIGKPHMWLNLDAFKKLCEVYKPETIKSYCSAILFFEDKGTSFYETIYEIRAESIEKTQSSRKLHEKTQKDILRWVSGDELIEVYDKLFSEYKKKPSKYLFVCLFYLAPFKDPSFGVLRNDLPTFTYMKGINYYDGEYLYMNDYKTHKYHGEIIIKLPPILKELFDDWISINDVREGQQIINMSKTMISRTLNKYIGVTSTTLRKIYVSWKHPEGYKSLQEMKETARLMAHSVVTADIHYFKE